MSFDPNDNSSDWIASCVVVLTIRWDEALQISSGEKQPNEKPTIKSSAATTPTDRVTGQVTTQTAGGPRTVANKKHRPRIAIADASGFQTNPLRGLGAVAGSQGGDAQILANPLGPLRHATPQSKTSNSSSQASSPRSGQRFTTTGDTGAPTVPLTLGTDGYTVVVNRVPKKGTFTLEHPRAAGKFKLSFDYHEFPVDARVIRAVGVEIHLGTVSADDYARGMNGEKDSDGRPLSILKTGTGNRDPWTGRPQPDAATLLFYGTCDTWDTDHGEGGSTIELEGRDLRGIFIDAKIAPAKVAQINLTQPIDLVVADIIRTMGVEHDLHMVVVTDINEWDDSTVPSPGDVEGLTRVRLGAEGNGAATTPQTGTKTSYWDLITNYCQLVGAIPVFQGTALWIRPAPKVFDALDGKSRLAPPFAGGKPRKVGSESLRARRLVFGREIKKLHFQRKFAGAVAPTVQCISMDDRARGHQRLIFGQWPPDATQHSPGAPGGIPGTPSSAGNPAQTKAESELLRVPVHGVRSVAQLTAIAHSIYEEVGRGETGGSCSTSNLSSYGGNNSDPDLLRLRPMEPVEFLVDGRYLSDVAPIVSELNNQERRTFSEEVDAVTLRIGDRPTARALVALARGVIPSLLSFYQVVGVQYEWGGGLRTSLTFQNYIVPRQQAKEDRAKQQAQQPSQPNLRVTRVDEPGAHRKAAARSGNTDKLLKKFPQTLHMFRPAAASNPINRGGGLQTATRFRFLNQSLPPNPADESGETGLTPNSARQVIESNATALDGGDF